VLLLATVLLASACGSGGANGGATGGADGGADGKGASQCAYPSAGEAARKVEPPPGEPTVTGETRAVLVTSAGDIPLTLEADKAPCTVNSFLALAEQDYFDGTSCHRLTTAGIYVLQCGDPTGTGTGGPGYRFDDELLESDPRIQPCREQQTAQGPTQVCTYGPGTVAMANSGPDTNGSQFFLVYGSSPLPANYTVFGRMDAAGLQVVKKIAEAGVGSPARATDGTPKTPVTITDVKVQGAGS
jgi:peptidyl-prolyl cis-trans isomerase B (cyclophilin B)